MIFYSFSLIFLRFSIEFYRFLKILRFGSNFLEKSGLQKHLYSLLLSLLKNILRGQFGSNWFSWLRIPLIFYRLWMIFYIFSFIFYRFSMIFFRLSSIFYRFSLIFYRFFWFSVDFHWISIDFQWFSVDFQWFSLIFKDSEIRFQFSGKNLGSKKSYFTYSFRIKTCSSGPIWLQLVFLASDSIDFL